jgi:hypothetical protein
VNDGSYNITQKDGIFFVKIGDVIKPISECSADELSQNNIVEKDGNLYIKIVNQKEVVKSIEECSDEEKLKN